MATTKFKGPVTSVNGFYFHPSAYTSARPMTVTCTTLVRSAGSSPSQSATLTGGMIGGLSKVTAAWDNIRQKAAATLVFCCGRPLNASNSAVIDLVGNTGIGQKFEGRACTIDCFTLGYVS